MRSGPSIFGMRLLQVLLALSASLPLLAAQTGSLDEARSKIQSGEYRAAAELLGEIVEAEPENAQASYLYGYALHAAGDMQRAVEVAK